MMRALFLVLVTLAAAPSMADVLPYKATLRAETTVTPNWAHNGDGLTPDQVNALVADAKGIELRFDLSRYVGRNVRIHMVLPPSLKGLRGSTGFRAEWRTRGRFIPGSIVPGNRTLVFQGVVTAKEMTEIFDFTLHLDGRYFHGGLGFDPVFEIESIGP
ncbi:MAG: hypothetical protein ABI790_14420 [Betaproteobacteria bacterium]